MAQGIDEVKKDWAFVRSETLELLESLNDETLTFKPDGERWQPIAYQFACIGRTQMVYARALQQGKMDFADFGDPMLPSKQSVRTRDDLLQLLNVANQQWLDAIEHGKREVKWPGATRSAASHAYRLASHERIHHGQLISYFTLAGWDLPVDFKKNWAL